MSRFVDMAHLCISASVLFSSIFGGSRLSTGREVWSSGVGRTYPLCDSSFYCILRGFGLLMVAQIMTNERCWRCLGRHGVVANTGVVRADKMIAHEMSRLIFFFFGFAFIRSLLA